MSGVKGTQSMDGLNRALPAGSTHADVASTHAEREPTQTNADALRSHAQRPDAAPQKPTPQGFSQTKDARLNDLERQAEHVRGRLEKQADGRPAQPVKKNESETNQASLKTRGQQSDKPERGKENSTHGKEASPRSESSHGEKGDSPRGEKSEAREAREAARQTARETRQDAREARQDAREAVRDAREATREASSESRGAARQEGEARGHDSQGEFKSGRGGGDGHAGRSDHVEGEEHGRGHVEDDGIGHGGGRGHVEGERGEHGENSLRDTARESDSVLRGLGRGLFGELGRARAEKLEKFVAQTLKQAERGEGEGHSWGRQGHEEGAAEHSTQWANKLAHDAVQLAKHFAQLEKQGGNTVQQAEEAATRFVFNGGGETNRSLHESSQRAGEMLRDLRAGAFLSAQDGAGPFLSDAHARAVGEAAELLHTLEAIERALGVGEGEGRALAGAFDVAELRVLVRAFASGGGTGLPGQLFELPPMLPGRAARAQIPAVMAGLEVPLVDARGRALLSKDGVLLKPGELLWLGVAGGLLAGRFDSEIFQAHLSSLLVNGFDALYSLMGFDGRSLTSPHFAAVQVQVNASDLEWVFGQPPLTEGWARAHIERLKDAAVPDLNTLGEMLEDALLDGRFHTLSLQGSVAEGEAVVGSFSPARLAASEPSFA